MKKKSPETSEILQELVKRLDKPKAPEHIRLSFFKRQLDFINDPAKFKAALCSRRAGKSVAAVGYQVVVCLENPDVSCLYGAMTRQSAKKIAWKELKKFDRRFKLNLTYNETELCAKFPNGSEITCMGVNDVTAVESLRGQHFKVIVLDEAASYGNHFRYTIEDVLIPTLIDDEGTLCLIGTPGAACTGPFYDATCGTDLEYSLHKWTILDNPFIPHAEKWLENFRKLKGWSADNPIYMREWRGIWIKSSHSLVYQYDESKNLETPADKSKLSYILGIDLGYTDASAFVVLGFSEDTPNIYVVDVHKESNLLPSDVARKVAQYQNKWQPVSTVCDTGGLGKAIVEEMRKRYGISIKAAEKRNKLEYIELINSDFYEGKVKIDPKCTPLLDEITLLQWQDDDKIEDSRYENHACDAMLYAWRESTHYGFKAKTPNPMFLGEEWAKKQMIELEEKLKYMDSLPWYER